MKKMMLQGALRTVGTLFGGLLLGLAVGTVVFHLLPGSDVTNAQIGHAAIAAVPALLGFVAGGWLWGRQMGRLANADDLNRMARAGMLGFAPITFVLVVGLGLGEPLILEALGHTAIHRVFTLLFVPSAFLIGGISAYAIGRGLGDRRLARALLWRIGSTAAATFLLINLTMEQLGWVVGAPGAAERATMVTVLALGNVGAALAGGAVLGGQLVRGQDRFAADSLRLS